MFSNAYDFLKFQRYSREKFAEFSNFCPIFKILAIFYKIQHVLNHGDVPNSKLCNIPEFKQYFLFHFSDIQMIRADFGNI